MDRRTPTPAPRAAVATLSLPLPPADLAAVGYPPGARIVAYSALVALMLMAATAALLLRLALQALQP